MNQPHLRTGWALQRPSQLRLRDMAASLAILVLLVTTAACSGSKSTGSTSPQARATALHTVAAQYAQTGDLNAAVASMAALKVANPAQLLISEAEDEVREGAPREGVEQLATLAGALGARSRAVQDYLAATPVAPQQAVAEVPPTAQPVEVASPTPQPAPTAAPTIAPTAIPPTAPPATTAPAKPRVTARDTVNLRAGPGTSYPLVGKMQAGQTLNIMGRNASGDWWRVNFPSEEQAWVASIVVDVAGPIDTVPQVQNIPTQAPAPVVQQPQPQQPQPQPQQPQPQPEPTKAPAPKPANGMQYVVKSFRLKPVGLDAQQCHGGDHNIWVYVEDAGGQRIDGVRVHEVWTNTIRVTGEKGPGAVVWDTYRGGGGQVEIVDDAGNRIGELSRGMSADWPDFDLMLGAGYCTCKPHPDEASCKAELESHAYFFAVGHYVFEVTYQRVG